MSSEKNKSSDAGAWLASLVAQPPRAARFIVTIYGDAVVPRRGILWMGTLIEIANAAGLSESLVRTAVSRLVAAGQLIGERVGRRSYYRLTDPAQVEFSAAESVLFSGQPDAKGWVFFMPENPNQPMPDDFVLIAKGVYLGPDKTGQRLPSGLVFHSSVVERAAMLPGYVSQYWDLAGVSAAYARVIDRFAPLADMMAAGVVLSPEDSLIARLLLVDDFRAAVLQDPRLPPNALPTDWPRQEATALFASLYLSLTPQADSHIAAIFRDASGVLPASTPQTVHRLAALKASLK